MEAYAQDFSFYPKSYRKTLESFKHGFAKSPHYSVRMGWRKEMSVDEDGSMVALDLGSDSDMGGKSALIPEIFRR